MIDRNDLSPEHLQALSDFEAGFKDAFRFGACTTHGAHSGLWRAWKNRKGDDFYLSARTLAGQLKVSLHASGKCRVALTDPAFRRLINEGLMHADSDRAFTKWKRPDFPPGCGAPIVRVMLPGPYMKLPAPREDGTKRLIFEVEPDKAAEISIVLVRDDAEGAERGILAAGAYPIYRWELEGGRLLVMAARQIEFDRSVVPSSDRLNSVPGRPLQTEIFNPGEDEVHGLSAVFWNDPNLDGDLRLIEVNGVSVKRRQP